MDRGAWQAIIHGVSKSRTQLSGSHTHTRQTHSLCPSMAQPSLGRGSEDAKAVGDQRLESEVRRRQDSEFSFRASNSGQGHSGLLLASSQAYRSLVREVLRVQALVEQSSSQ